MPALDQHCRHFILLSPFLCLGTSGADGRHDVSPRGDPPGFVQVLDDKTLLIPERPDFPSYGRIVHDQRRPDEAVGDIEDRIEKNYREELY